MSFISILLPAFYCQDSEFEKIVHNILKQKDFSVKQFGRSEDDMEMILIRDEPLEYAINFRKFDLSVEKIEDLINQRNNMRIILEKTYESMNVLMKKFNENENNINSITKTPNNK